MSALFEAFGLDVKLLLIQALNFGLFLLILWRFVYAPVMKMLDERRQKIADGVAKAQAADRALADADAEGKGMVAGAAREAQDLLASARARAEEQATEVAKRSQREAERILADAAARAEEARRQALSAGEKEIARAAMLAAEKILKEKHS